MKPFRLFSKASSPRSPVSVVCSSSDLETKLQAQTIDPVFITGFVSPHLDLDAVARRIRQRYAQCTLSLCTTSGELYNDEKQLYCDTGDRWDRIVLQLFDRSVIASAEIAMVPLESADIRGAGKRASMRERISRLVDNLKAVQVRTAIDQRDTLAYVLFDGLSASESFFMEALYESGRFPCLFVGGSAGGKGDFQKTLIHDGSRSYENHAQIVFLKCAPHIRFG
ncbi:MAG: FIST N-terminal domain-containing protein, partial [Pseudomonas sp.]|uniref:FIST N-terminal domain-containing protein n=1 Tax=Pseudomonas sp. TaxID=306 RepID=UPI0030F02DC3